MIAFWSKRGVRYLEVSLGGPVPESGLASWVAKPPRNQSSPHKAWIIYPEMAEVQLCPKQRKQGQGGKTTGGKP
jgi:hypothetical protein